MPAMTRMPEEEAAFMERLHTEHRSRLPGLHLTDAIWCNIGATVKPALEAAGIEVRYSDATILRFSEGVMWEKALIKGDWRQQYEVGSPDDESTGTVDAMLPRTWFPIEAKTTKRSTLADLPDSTLTQLGGYAARLMLSRWPIPCDWEGRIRTLHKDGDCGKNKCPEHGYPETETRRLNPETKRQKLCCPECEEFLVGDRTPQVRFYKIVWERDELLSLHKLLTWRLGELKADRALYRAQFAPHGLELAAIATSLDSRTLFPGKPLPEWKWGYPETECDGCEVRKLIGCPGQEDIDKMEAEMTGSITALEGVTA